jgi:hypothetical protein
MTPSLLRFPAQIIDDPLGDYAILRDEFSEIVQLLAGRSEGLVAEAGRGDQSADVGSQTVRVCRRAHENSPIACPTR